GRPEKEENPRKSVLKRRSGNIENRRIAGIAESRKEEYPQNKKTRKKDGTRKGKEPTRIRISSKYVVGGEESPKDKKDSERRPGWKKR
ncbi:MAG: hypothetical protein LUD14_12120, partial [Clostridiales bacterium]|nr:hypothetical protein [Clostridiales bacterium]